MPGRRAADGTARGGDPAGAVSGDLGGAADGGPGGDRAADRSGARRHARGRDRSLARRILDLALPALGALVAEPLFLLADSAILGHLGVAQLAGAGLGMTVVHTVVGLMVFLAYATTPAVARRLGAGDVPGALSAGRDGVWLALLLGVVLALTGIVAAQPLTGWLGASGQVQAYAVSYVHGSLPGLPAMLMVLAATGVLRGLLDTRTPLLVAGVGFGLNIALNLVLVYGVGLGVVGSALGTSTAQGLMVAAYLVVLVPRLRRAGVRLAPSVMGVLGTARVGSWLMLRTLTLRAAIVATVTVATRAGAVTLAAHQLVFTMFSTLAFTLDALAIAAQALIGNELGAGDRAAVRALTRTLTGWGVGFGAVAGAALAAVAVVVAPLFTPDPAVQAAFTAGMWVLALAQPLCGYVFVLDGVLIGAGDARYLALAGVVTLLPYLPALAAVASLGTPDGAASVVPLWLAFGLVLMGARALTLGLRARTDAWLR